MGIVGRLKRLTGESKSDYELEGICLQRNEALEAMNALLWAAVSFFYPRLESLGLEIVFHPELDLVKRQGFRELFRCIFYKLAFGVKKLLALSKLYGMNPLPSTSKSQLSLALA